MEKDAFEFLANQATVAADKSIKTDGAGRIFKIGENVREFIPDNLPDTLQVSTLSSVVDFISNAVDASESENDQLLLEVLSPSRVVLESVLDKYGRRKQLITAKLSNEPFEFGRWFNREDLNIALQSQFVANEDQAVLLRFIGNYKESQEQIATDDGTTQVASVRTGAASVDNVKVPNPATLAPYRTFAEIEQPKSQFVFRMGEGMQGALFEADGGAWKNVAIKSIKEYFADKLSEEIAAHHVVVLG